MRKDLHQGTRRRAVRIGRGAFTLIELLVVVAIIALLISILLPSLNAAREQTRAVKCAANLKSIGIGIILYSQDQDGMLPGPLHPPVYRNTGAEGTWFHPMNPNSERPWFLLARLAPYMSAEDHLLEYTDRVSICPTAYQRNPDENFRPNVGGNPQHSRPYNYLINSWMNTKPAQYFGWINIGYTWSYFVQRYRENPNDPAFQPPKKLDQIRKSAEEWAVGDAWWALKRVMIRPGVFQDSMLGTWQVNLTPTNYSHNPLPKKPYHKKDRGTNLLFFDGHGATFEGIDEWAQKFPANRADTP